MNTAYRVWDGKQMHYWDDEGISLGIIGTQWVLWRNDRYGFQNCITGSHEEGSVLMWGTGLKDKKWKDIYQKDITEESFMNPLLKENVIDRYVIERRKGIDRMNHVSKKSQLDRFLWYRLDEIEVVGNIFENPELLEGAE
ncbi:YopX family protein [Bacillus subtilis]|uniref:YopX family protein n=1 Tax=Bacillus subtilis TaxID=1423 RepID=UPI00142D43F6|nr:YopX family protein [Bacillus subtilis]WGD75154.1 YopX family protein [Bacillus subtilis]